MYLSLKGPFLLSNYHNFDTWGEAALHGVSPLAGNLFAK